MENIYTYFLLQKWFIVVCTFANKFLWIFKTPSFNLTVIFLYLLMSDSLHLIFFMYKLWFLWLLSLYTMSYSVSFYPDEINPLFPAKIFPPIHLSLFFYWRYDCYLVRRSDWTSHDHLGYHYSIVWCLAEFPRGE